MVLEEASRECSEGLSDFYSELKALLPYCTASGSLKFKLDGGITLDAMFSSDSRGMRFTHCLARSGYSRASSAKSVGELKGLRGCMAGLRGRREFN